MQDKDEDPVPAETGQNHPFFRRSDSMTFLGCIPPNPFDVPLPEAIPLADQPHLLQVSDADQYIGVIVFVRRWSRSVQAKISLQEVQFLLIIDSM